MSNNLSHTLNVAGNQLHLLLHHLQLHVNIYHIVNKVFLAFKSLQFVQALAFSCSF